MASAAATAPARAATAAPAAAAKTAKAGAAEANAAGAAASKSSASSSSSSAPRSASSPPRSSSRRAAKAPSTNAFAFSVPQAKRFVVIGTVGTGVISAIAVYRRGDHLSPRLLVGVLASGVILAVGAEVAPALAGSFALLMLTTSVFVLGGDAWAGLSHATSSSSSSSNAHGTDTTSPNVNTSNLGAQIVNIPH